jgi:hypothetical protein
MASGKAGPEKGDGRGRRLRGEDQSAVFREVNERVWETHERFGHDLPLEEFICECADASCGEQISLKPDEYRAVRRKRRRYVVLPSLDHVYPEVDRVIERSDRYWVIEKLR